MSRSGARSAGDLHRRYRAFGLDIDSDMDVRGLVAGEHPAADTPVRLRRVPVDRLRAEWEDPQTVRLRESRREDGTLVGAIEQHPARGFRLSGSLIGDHEIAHDGSAIRTALPPGPPARAQAWLLAQVLPLAAVLRGLEVFHASAVRLPEGVVAIAAPSGAGKSSVAVHLALGGASLLTDDVLALDLRDGEVTAHHGHAVVGVRDTELARLSPRQRARLGTEVLAESGRTRFEGTLQPCADALRAVCFLERSGARGEIRLDRVEPVDPRLLLAHTFNFLVKTPERLRTQLETCSAIARSCVVLRVRIPARTTAEEVATALRDHVQSALGPFAAPATA